MWIKHILQDLGCHKTVILNHNTAADSWKVFGVHVHVCVCHGFKLSDIPKWKHFPTYVQSDDNCTLFPVMNTQLFMNDVPPIKFVNVFA